MSEFLSRFNNGGELIGLVSVVGVFACGVVSIITLYHFKMRQIALKEEMVNRGMSAEEIQTVLNAGKRSCSKRGERSNS